ncbi:Hypothetical protein LUCI_0492 [Lucifera butyrica]|uniref:Uncharacterized protein n=1 Tax=Lucifera butyrica TaxID=1351585 RepID=A0A498R2A4_9FIRM|nr:magnesium transporter CorA family protein [Lucifera butyrica]VBB05285.1 Hypothetical protein LUCI_0492 [Lucifera butyrica]
MLTICKSIAENYVEIPLSDLGQGTWLNIVNPTPAEIKQVAAATGVPADFLQAAYNEQEYSRIVIGKKCILVIMNIPVMHDADAYDTAPLAVILTPDHIITSCRLVTDILPDIHTPPKPMLLPTDKGSMFLFQILYHMGSVFLRHIYAIRHRTDEIEQRLRKSLDNVEIFQLLNLAKGLAHFTASLRANGIVLETILRLRSDPRLHSFLKMYEEEEDILENVIIENKRALEIVQTYSEILSSMMDAFSSAVGINLNRVMKFLASVTILLSIPALVTNFWSMSLVVPWQGTQTGFWHVVIICLVLTGSTGYILWRKRMF